MNIIVCLKPAPDPKQWHKLKLDPKTRTLVRAGIDSVINPLDKNALEAALVIKEKFGGQVTVVSMAPPDAKPVLKQALAMGADKAVLMSDRAFAGSDTLGTAHVLAEAIKGQGQPDVVLCGDETIDGGTAQVSAQIGEYLGLPNLMHVNRITPPEEDPAETWTVRCEVEQGGLVVEIKPPFVLSVVKTINTPRYVTMMNILQAEQKEIQIRCVDDVCLTERCVGLADSPTQMADLFMPEKKGHAEMLQGDAEAMAAELAGRLHRLGFC